MVYPSAILSLFLCQAVYPELVGIVGWNVPNYQGVFLRGYGGQISYHYGAVNHWSTGVDGLQWDGIRAIYGIFVGGDWPGHNNQGGNSRAFWSIGSAGVQKGKAGAIG